MKASSSDAPRPTTIGTYDSVFKDRAEVLSVEGAETLEDPPSSVNRKSPLGSLFFGSIRALRLSTTSPDLFPNLSEMGAPKGPLAFVRVVRRARQGRCAALLLVKDASKVHSYLSKVRGGAFGLAVDQRSPTRFAHRLSTLPRARRGTKASFRVGASAARRSRKTRRITNSRVRGTRRADRCPRPPVLGATPGPEPPPRTTCGQLGRKPTEKNSSGPTFFCSRYLGPKRDLET